MFFTQVSHAPNLCLPSESEKWTQIRNEVEERQKREDEERRNAALEAKVIGSLMYSKKSVDIIADF